MSYLLNIAYLLVIVLLSPWLLYKSLTTGKYRRGLWRKLTGGAFLRQDDRPCVWFHGVSVGEIHLLRQVVAAFRRRHPEWTCVVSTTTDTGFDEARKRFPDLAVFFWPLDFTWAVSRAIRRVRPSLIVLAEGELWPNFLRGCEKMGTGSGQPAKNADNYYLGPVPVPIFSQPLTAARRQGVPVAVVNGRMSPRSLGRYRFLSWLTRQLWGRIDLYAVQTEEYAANFRALGASSERVHVTGSVKYDGVESDRNNPRTQHLRRLLGIEQEDLVWIAGSTQAPEEEIVVGINRRLRERHPNLRLIVVPRQKERFDAVAALLRNTGEPFIRRSELGEGNPSSGARIVTDHPVTLSPCHPVTPSPLRPIILVDTIGELGALWGLADVAFVGGSLDGRRGGQNMIEPAAYGAAVLFGPHIWNFRDTASRLVEAGAAIKVPDAESLEIALGRLLAGPADRHQLGKAARTLVSSQQGATERTLDLIDSLLSCRFHREKAA